MKRNIHKIIEYCQHNPDLVLLQALVLSLPFERIPSVDVLSISLRPSLLFGLLLIIRVLWRLRTERLRHNLPRGVSLLGLLFIWICLLIPASMNQSRALQVVVFTGFTILVSVSVALTWISLKGAGRKLTIRSLYFTAIVTCIFGAFQYFGNFVGLPWYITGLSDRYSWAVFGFARIQSTGLEPLYFASFLLLPLLVFISEKIYQVKIFRYDTVILALFAFVLTLTLSRGAIYGFVVAVLGLAVLGLVYQRKKFRKNIKWAVLPLILGFSLAIISIQIFNRPSLEPTLTEGKQAANAYVNHLTSTGLEGGGDDRAKFRRIALHASTENPARFLLGYGPGQFGPYMQATQKSEGWAIVNNLPLELLFETGVIGLSIFVIFMGWLLWRSWQLLRKCDAATFGLIGGLVAYFLSQLVQYQTFSTLYVVHIWVAIGLTVGVVTSGYTSLIQQKKNT